MCVHVLENASALVPRGLTTYSQLIEFVASRHAPFLAQGVGLAPYFFETKLDRCRSDVRYLVDVAIGVDTRIIRCRTAETIYTPLLTYNNV